MARSKKPLFASKHLFATLFRRWIVLTRSLKTIISAIVATLIFSSLAIICQYLMTSMLKESSKPATFKSIQYLTDDFVIARAYDQNDVSAKEFSTSMENILNGIFYNETNMNPHYYEYSSIDQANQEVYKLIEDKDSSKVTYLMMGLGFGNTVQNAPSITLMYNASSSSGKSDARMSIIRMLWKYIFGNDANFKFSDITMNNKMQDMLFGQLGPMLICTGLVSIAPLIITLPITDINGEIRPFMISATLTLLPYWVGTFIVDFIIWTISSTIVWLLFLIFQIPAFLDNAFTTWYVMETNGISIILFLYCMSFLFSTPDGASRQAFFILILLLIVPMIIDLVLENQSIPDALSAIYGLIPPVNLMKTFSSVLSASGTLAKSLGYYFAHKPTQILLIETFTNIVLYIIILVVIEQVRKWLHRKGAKLSFGNYTEFFRAAKAKHPVDENAHKMEEEVHNPANDSKWAVKIDNISRLFFNTAGQPIPAVNCVSLGVEKGSLFGFLGANGAGKTTLISMITSLLPPSDGKILINGVDIAEYHDPTLLSVCPQFNNHLCNEMTIAEHFRMYSMLFQLDKEAEEEKTNKLIRTLELEEIKDIPLRELSAGDVRKLAIALCFLGPAEIILLDEPTASLDPVARHHVHEMISEFKGQKTFMLCTHLLSEAETLCDTISIMIKGNVYTVGSPAELSSKFGTEFKIDVALEDESVRTGQMADRWFARNLPMAEISIIRPMARIYSIPAKDINMSELFKTMKKGKESKESGIAYYTCSSSSLERVFMEIVKMSESEETVAVGGKKPRHSSIIRASDVPLSDIDAQENNEFVVP